jgi:hypothetical protein
VQSPSPAHPPPEPTLTPPPAPAPPPPACIAVALDPPLDDDVTALGPLARLVVALLPPEPPSPAAATV